MKYVMALDQGTTSSRAIIFNRRGRIKSMAQREFRQIYPRPGWVEHRPEEIWSSQSSVAAEALAQAGLSAADLVAIGITNQRETALIWDRKTGKPIYNAIVWQDRRTAAWCDTWKGTKTEARVRRKTGLMADPYFAGTKIRWMLNNVKGARKKAERGDLAFGTVDSWLLWKLTGGRVHATDTTNASRTLCYNIHEGAWDDELLDFLDVPRALLPEVRSSSEIYGEVHRRSILADVPIAGIAGDQHAALFGQTCFKPGIAKNTYGTGCFLLMHTGTKAVTSKNNLLTTIAWTINGKTEYALEGSVFTAGAVVQWMRDGLNFIPSAPGINRLALSVPDTDGVYIVPAFSGLGAPHWDPHARGLIIGLTRGTTRAHLARAALESIAYQSYDVLKAMEADAGLKLKTLRVDGGASASRPLMQFQADLLRVPVVRPRVTETTALGAAYLAGLAVGFWKNLAEIADQWAIHQTFKRKQAAKEMTAKLNEWHRAVERAKAWAEIGKD